MNGYDLSRNFWDFTFENPEKIKVHHIAIYFFAVEHCNRLGWKKKFGFPTSMVLDAVGLKSYSSYKRYFDELVEWGMFKVHEYSKNQYSSNIIELTLNIKADVKALDKALSKHSSKQFDSTTQSSSSIDKPLNKEQLTIKEDGIPFSVFWDLYDKKIDPKKCEPKWNRLSLEDQKKAIEYIPRYIRANPDKSFRRNPETFLNNHTWLNEIVEPSPTVNGQPVQIPNSQSAKPIKWAN